MSLSVTLPLKAALTGPMRSRTLALISVSEDLSSDSQPGMQAFSTSGSFSAANTFSRGAAILYSPLMSISRSYSQTPPHSHGEENPSACALPLAGIGVRRRFCQRLPQGDIDGGQIRNRHQEGEEGEPVGLRVPEQ